MGTENIGSYQEYDVAKKKKEEEREEEGREGRVTERATLQACACEASALIILNVSSGIARGTSSTRKQQQGLGTKRGHALTLKACIIGDTKARKRERDVTRKGEAEEER